jgi:uncharacterized protein
MQLKEVYFGNALPVDGYGPGFFRIGGQVWQSGVLLSLAGVTEWRGFSDVPLLVALSGDIDVLFIGTGTEISQLPKSLTQKLEAAGIGVEVMNSPSACRTYNVLLSEGRRIAAALLPVD